MEAWQERLQEEYNELSDRLVKLSAFLTRQEADPTINEVSHALLVAQHGAMTAYQAILWTRISTTVSVKAGA
jgi:hypothetical protein